MLEFKESDLVVAMVTAGVLSSAGIMVDCGCFKAL